MTTAAKFKSLAALSMPAPGLQKDFAALSEAMGEQESKRSRADRVFYLSIPPSIFTQVAGAAAKAASSP